MEKLIFCLKESWKFRLALIIWIIIFSIIVNTTHTEDKVVLSEIYEYCVLPFTCTSTIILIYLIYYRKQPI